MGGTVVFRGELTLDDGHVIAVNTSQSTSGDGGIEHVRGVLRAAFTGLDSDATSRLSMDRKPRHGGYPVNGGPMTRPYAPGSDATVVNGMPPIRP